MQPPIEQRAPGEQADLALAAQWLSAQFLAPPDAEAVQASRALATQAVLETLGVLLNAQAEMSHLRRMLADGDPRTLAERLQQRHVALFEGVFRQRALPPYASCWDGHGRLCGPATSRMQAILRRLDVHLAEGQHELPDHLGVQLAALALALERQDADGCALLLTELDWAYRFAAALTAADRDGFYASLAQLLTALLDRLRPRFPDPRPTSSSEHPLSGATP